MLGITLKCLDRDNMNLYLTVFERIDADPDWFTWTSENEPTDNQELKKIKQHLKENEDESEIGDYWTNRISEVDGYKIKLVKEIK